MRLVIKTKNYGQSKLTIFSLMRQECLRNVNMGFASWAAITTGSERDTEGSS